MTLPPLYAIVDPLDTGRDPIDLATQMLAGGARLLQLRLKTAGPRETYRIASHLRALTQAAGALEAHGAKSIFAYASHGVLSGPAISRINARRL